MDESIVKHLEQPAELDEVSKLLLRAADLIEKKGWSNGCLETTEGRHCVEGAIRISATGCYYRSSAVGDAAEKRICDYFGVPYASTWNNSAKDGAEVVAGVRRIALGG